MVETDRHLNLHPIYILDIYKVLEHIAMLSIGLQDIGLGPDGICTDNDGTQDHPRNNRGEGRRTRRKLRRKWQ